MEDKGCRYSESHRLEKDQLFGSINSAKKSKSKYSRSLQVIHQYRVEIPLQKERSTNKDSMAGE